MKCRHGRLGKCPMCEAEVQDRKDIAELKKRVRALEIRVQQLLDRNVILR